MEAFDFQSSELKDVKCSSDEVITHEGNKTFQNDKMLQSTDQGRMICFT